MHIAATALKNHNETMEHNFLSHLIYWYCGWSSLVAFGFGESWTGLYRRSILS